MANKSSSAIRIPFLVDGIRRAISDFENLDRELDGLDESSRAALAPIKELPEELQEAAKEAEATLRSLGLRSQRTARIQNSAVRSQIERLRELRDQGVITAQDYEDAMRRANEKTDRNSRLLASKWERRMDAMADAANRVARAVTLAAAATARMSGAVGVAGLQRTTSGFLTLGRAATSAAALVGTASTAIGRGIAMITKIGGTLFGGAVIGGGGAAGMFLKSVADTSGEFERIATALKATVGEDYERASAFITKTSEGVVYSQEQIAQSLLRLRNFGFGQGSAEATLPALIDQVSKLGGTYEDLEGITLAVGQAWAKQKLQGEEILQMVERGVPVWELLQKVTGKSVQEIQKMSEAGELGRDTMAALFSEIGRSASGAAAGQLDTYGGLVARLEKGWATLKRTVGGSGVFDAVKDEMKGWIEYLGKPSTIKLATEFAEIGADAMVFLSNAVKRLIEEFGPRSLATLRWWISRAAGMFNQFLDGADSAFGGAVEFIESSAEAIFNLGRLIGNNLSPILNVMTTITEAVRRGFEALDNDTTGNFVLNVSEGITAAVEAIGKAFAGIDKESATKFFDALGMSISKIGAFALEFSEGESMNAALETFKTLLNDVASILENGLLSADVELPLLRSFQQLVEEYLPKVENFFGRVEGFFDNPGASLADGISAMMRGLVFDFIPWLAQLLDEMFSRLVENAVGAVGDFFKGVGDWFGEGKRDGAAELEAIFSPGAAVPAASLNLGPTTAPPTDRVMVDLRMPSGSTLSMEGNRSEIENLRREIARLESSMSYR